MTQNIIDYFQNYIDNEYLLLFVLSVVPLVEMRGSIVLSAGMQINHFLAFLTCASASSLVAIPVLLIFRPIMNALKKTKLLKPLAVSFEQTVETRAQTVKKGKKRGGNYAYWALFVFVAIPLPMTGIWTGSCVAAFLGLKYWKTLGFMTAGNFLACGVLSLLVIWAKEYVDIILLVFLIIMVFGILVVVWEKHALKKKKKLESAKQGNVKMDNIKPKEQLNINSDDQKKSINENSDTSHAITLKQKELESNENSHEK